MPMKNPYENILCLLCSTACPVFEERAKITFSAPSDVISDQNRSILA